MKEGTFEGVTCDELQERIKTILRHPDVTTVRAANRVRAVAGHLRAGKVRFYRMTTSGILLKGYDKKWSLDLFVQVPDVDKRSDVLNYIKELPET